MVFGQGSQEILLCHYGITSQTTTAQQKQYITAKYLILTKDFCEYFHDGGITDRLGIKSCFWEEMECLSGVNAKPSACHFTNTPAPTPK